MNKHKNSSVVFMGTPDFAVPSLRAILEAGYEVKGVVTAPDRPAGRGRKITKSAVKAFAEEHGLKIMQPVNLKDPVFIEELRSLDPGIQVVVAFRMLPKDVWQLPGLGTFNLHASLLPEYRGAAPINWAIINGEKKTGLTTFLIDEMIDTGKILLQEEITIKNDDTAGTLHDRMMEQGAEMVVKTIDMLESGDYTAWEQSVLKTTDNLKPAPKLTRESTRIEWNRPAESIRNFIRGLSPYPGAYTYISGPEGKKHQLKVFLADIGEEIKNESPGTMYTDNRKYIAVCTADRVLYLTDIQLEGKKRMPVEALLRGFSPENSWKAL